MHRIKMPPFAAPDETVTLEVFDDFSWPVLARKGFHLCWRLPAPIGGLLHVEINRRTERVLAEPFGTGDFPPVKRAGQLVDIGS